MVRGVDGGHSHWEAGQHRARRKELLFVAGALMASIPIVYVRSIYFRSITIEYDWPIPHWLEVWDHSNLVGTKAVCLLWLLYWSIAFASSGVNHFCGVDWKAHTWPSVGRHR